MSAIRIRRHLDSETLHLPELRGMIGRDVEIIVRDEAHETTVATSAAASGEFWNPPSLDQLARRQGYRGPFDFHAALGALGDADWEGFDEYLDEMRRAPQEDDGAEK
jgi:hypothetical protein